MFVVLGGCFRFWQGYTIAYYTLEFFAGWGKEKEEEFGVLNSLSVVIGGFSSNFFGARLSDKLEPRYPLIKPWMCVLMSIAGVVTNCLCYLFTFNFYILLCCFMKTSLAFSHTIIDNPFGLENVV